MRSAAVIIILFACITSCKTTSEYSATGRRMNSYVDCAYMGTFSSVSVINKNRRNSEFSDTLTAIADYVYDSVVKAKVKYLKLANITSAINKDETAELTKELTKCAVEFQRGASMDSIYPSAVINNVAAMSSTRYSSYLINYGNIWSKKQHRRYVAGQTLMTTAVVIGIALIVTLEVMAASNGERLGLFDGNGNSNTTNYDEPENGKYEGRMSCVYMIYDKEKGSFCYIRRAQFNSDKTDNNTFNPQRVSEQIDVLFGNKTKVAGNS
jgi:hypothetical protein